MLAPWVEKQTNPKDKRMDDVETEITKLVAKEVAKRRFDDEDANSGGGTIVPFGQETELERLSSSIAQSTSSSIDELKHLTSELQKLENLLNSEVRRVKREIDNALAGIKIIAEAIEPWNKSISPPLVPTDAA